MSARDSTARFEFSTPNYRLSTRGIARRLAPTKWDGARVWRAVQAMLGRPRPGDCDRPIVVGAIPFDTTRTAHLYLPESTRWSPPLTDGEPVADQQSPRLRVSGCDSPTFREAVRRAVAAISQGHLDKVVLARTIEITADAPYQTDHLYQSLRAANPAAYTFMLDLPSGSDLAPPPSGVGDTDHAAVLLGASPELVLGSNSGVVSTHPLAGSAPRLPDRVDDEAIAQALLSSPKNRQEHALVAQMALDTFASHTFQTSAPRRPQLVRTPKLWHLGTPISGQLHPGTSAMELLYALHPTPAVCGWPTDEAKRTIADLEEFDRGLYAGVIGWIDAAGDGEWALILRSGVVQGASATLFAGAGIVGASDPDAEHDETALKFRTFASALGHTTIDSGSQHVTTSDAANPTDDAAARIRRDLAAALDLDPGSIDDEDNLFDHGLDSVRLMSLVETWDTSQQPVDFAALLADPRIVSWAHMLRS